MLLLVIVARFTGMLNLIVQVFFILSVVLVGQALNPDGRVAAGTEEVVKNSIKNAPKMIFVNFFLAGTVATSQGILNQGILW